VCSNVDEDSEEESEMNRDDVLRRYRHLRAIGTHHHGAALNHVARPAIMEYAKRLGLKVGRTLIADSEEDVTLVFDLAIYTARGGRSRAIDRYAKTVRLLPDSDEVGMLHAMCRARFSIWRIDRRHDTCGFMVSDLLREAESWLVDEGLESSDPIGACFAGRLCYADEFAITSGVVVPVDRSMLEGVLTDALIFRHPDLGGVGDDPRFASAIYRAAIDQGAMHDAAVE
jgi:hypothetical protein